ncbi:MAG TPA: hypothetical protein EYG85_09010 [Crocinitomix sp.]|nr:hypothetical protein [Crocinitomix sp.]
MKKVFVLIFLLVVVTFTYSQRRYNLGFGIRAGVANYLGDIGSGDLARGFVYNLELKDTRWSTGAFVRWRFHPSLAYQASFTYARIQGDDKNSSNRARLGRNLSFTNDLLMINNKLEYYPAFMTVSDVGKKGRYRWDYKTYFFAGLGIFYHNPKAEYNGQKYKLRPLMTEGVKYSPIVLSIPTGAGFYFTYKRQHRFGFEMSWNMTFTDYLDDVSRDYVNPNQMATDPMAAILANRNPELNEYGSLYPVSQNYGYYSDAWVNQRGDPKDKDNFMMISLSYSYVIRTKNSFSRSYSWIYKRRSKFGGKKARF